MLLEERVYHKGVEGFPWLVRRLHDAVPPTGRLAFPLDSERVEERVTLAGLPLAFAGATKCQLPPLSAFPTGSNE
jgi:hypothetical protein